MFPEGDEDDVPYDNVVDRLTEYFKGLSSPALNLALFNNMKQKDGEGVKDFQLRLLHQAELCGFAENEAMVRERFSRGLKNSELA